MPDIQWDAQASLMRVTEFATADPQEELLARGTLLELVGAALEMPAARQDGLLLRAAGPDWVQEYDGDAIRELAARPEYTGAHGAFDTADLPEDPDRAEAGDEDTLIDGAVSGPSHTDMRGQDGKNEVCRSPDHRGADGKSRLRPPWVGKPGHEVKPRAGDRGAERKPESAQPSRVTELSFSSPGTSSSPS